MSSQVLIVIFLGTYIIAFALVSVVLVMHYEKRQAREKAEMQRMAFAHENDMLRTRMNEQEQAKKIISEELHDNVVQVLGHSRMYLKKLSGHVDREGKTYLDHIDMLTKKVVDDLRFISHGLNSELVESIGLTRSVEREIAWLGEASGMNCGFTMNGEPFPLGKGRDLLAFRIVQEAIQNAVKHARAGLLEVSFAYTPEALAIVIKDDGVGFDDHEPGNPENLGLKNIAARARLLQAEVNIASGKTSGTVIQLLIPFSENYHEYIAKN